MLPSEPNRPDPVPPTGLIPPAPRRSFLLAARSFLVAGTTAFAVNAFAAFALAGEGQDAQRRLDDRYFFVVALARGWDPLVSDIVSTITDLPEGERGGARLVRDEVFERYGEARLAAGGEPGERRAFEMFDVLSLDHSDEAKRPVFGEKCSAIDVIWADRAEKAGRDKEALDFAVDALKRTKNYEPALGIVARLAVKEAKKAEELDEFVRALEILETASAQLPPGSPSQNTVNDETRHVRETTGEVAIEWLGDWAVVGAVKGVVTDFRAAQITFRPTGGAKQPPVQTPLNLIRVRNGPYQVQAQGKGPATYTPATPVDVTSSGAVVTLLTALPDGMVVVPAVAGQDAFLMDRLEVTNAIYKLHGGASEGDAENAANGIDFPDAQRFVAACGKALPTKDQWRTAAFGSPTAASPRFPWGDQEAKRGTHVVDAEQPGPANACPEGASKFSGCLNMAGNVWEWLSDGWFIGGSYKQVTFEREFDTKEQGGPEWKADYLRDAAPALPVWTEMQSASDRGKYSFYRVRDATQLGQIGVRCIVALGAPRRQKQ